MVGGAFSVRHISRLGYHVVMLMWSPECAAAYHSMIWPMEAVSHWTVWSLVFVTFWNVIDAFLACLGMGLTFLWVGLGVRTKWSRHRGNSSFYHQNTIPAPYIKQFLLKVGGFFWWFMAVKLASLGER